MRSRTHRYVIRCALTNTDCDVGPLPTRNAVRRKLTQLNSPFPPDEPHYYAVQINTTVEEFTIDVQFDLPQDTGHAMLCMCSRCM